MIADKNFLEIILACLRERRGIFIDGDRVTSIRRDDLFPTHLIFFLESGKQKSICMFDKSKVNVRFEPGLAEEKNSLLYI